MRLLLDQGLPRSTVRHLAERDIIAEHVGDLSLAQAADREILDVARERHAAVVTLDADFHALLATSRAESPSVVRIRIEGLNGEQLASLLVQVLSVAGMELEAGALVSVTTHRIRVRTLPIGR
jgi:predicted nuclease of predicted toxin-antitoxin system